MPATCGTTAQPSCHAFAILVPLLRYFPRHANHSGLGYTRRALVQQGPPARAARAVRATKPRYLCASVSHTGIVRVSNNTYCEPSAHSKYRVLLGPLRHSKRGHSCGVRLWWVPPIRILRTMLCQVG